MAENNLYGDVHAYGAVAAETAAATAKQLVRLQELQVYLAQAKDRQNHTGTQLGATISDLDAIIAAAIQKVVGAAPAALDTLVEIAAQLASDETAAGALTTRATAVEGRVTTVEGRLNSRYLATLGDGTASVLTVTHGLGSLDVRVEVLDLSQTRQTVYPIVTRTDVNTVRLDFGTYKPAANTVRVLVDANP